MPTQQIALIAKLLNLAKPGVLLTVASLVLAPVSRGESTWDMANRICDRYFSDNPDQAHSIAMRAA